MAANKKNYISWPLLQLGEVIKVWPGDWYAELGQEREELLRQCFEIKGKTSSTQVEGMTLDMNYGLLRDYSTVTKEEADHKSQTGKWVDAVADPSNCFHFLK